MVAPALVSRPTRVFARITYTGEDKNLSPVCCDLSRVAAIAAAHPLPSNFGNTISRETSSKLLDPMLLQALEQSMSPSNYTLPEQNDTHSEGAEILNKNRKRRSSSAEDSTPPAKSAKRHMDSLPKKSHNLDEMALPVPLPQ